VEGNGTLPELKELLRRDIARLSRRYDAIILVSAPDQVAQGLPRRCHFGRRVLRAHRSDPHRCSQKSIDEIEQSGGRSAASFSGMRPIRR